MIPLQYDNFRRLLTLCFNTNYDFSNLCCISYFQKYHQGVVLLFLLMLLLLIFRLIEWRSIKYVLVIGALLYFFSRRVWQIDHLFLQITSNVITSNELILNEITSNRITSNAITSNGITSNAIILNAITSNAITLTLKKQTKKFTL